jgi:hypothetical protein
MVLSLQCLLTGHDDRVVRSPARLWLQCDHCGRETAGWQLRREARPFEENLQPAAKRPNWRRQPAEG